MNKPSALPTNSGYPHPSWLPLIQEEILSPRHDQLTRRLSKCSQEVYPHPSERYSAFRLPPDRVKVIILGQDPYHGVGQAHGLAFSVKPGVPVPPSLRNIYLELEQEGFGSAKERDGYLQPWAEQGVFLLNTVLTVNKDEAGSHRGWGWEALTDLVIHSLSENRNHLVFMLWGEDAKKKKVLVDESKHLVLTSPHPSPLSAHRGFLGNNHFKTANDWLREHKLREIEW